MATLYIFPLRPTKHKYTNIDGRRRVNTTLPLDKTKKGNKLPRKNNWSLELRL
jgi:hypothetical protein